MKLKKLDLNAMMEVIIFIFLWSCPVIDKTV